MKKLNLSKYEKEILSAFEKGELVESKDSKNIKKDLLEAAKYTLEKLKKEKNMNLRVTESDLILIKNKAIKNGIPYQTMISALLHQFATGKITIIL